MRSKKLFVVIGVIGIIVIVIVFGIIYNMTTENIRTISTIADEDSFVDAKNPTTNYGTHVSFEVGVHTLSSSEALFHFDFSDKPTDWTKAEISLYINYISGPIDVDVYLITESWNEDKVKWTNKPSHGQKITSLTVDAQSKYYNIDVSNYISGDGISICLSSSDSSVYLMGYTKENTLSTNFAPKLIWTY